MVIAVVSIFVTNETIFVRLDLWLFNEDRLILIVINVLVD